MRYSAPLLLLLTLLSSVATAQTLTPQEVVRRSVQHNPKMAELGLTVREAQLDAHAQQGSRPWTLRSEAGLQFDEQPSVGVIDTGVRRTTTVRGSAELLKQFVTGTTLALRLDLSRTVSEIPFTVPDLNIDETRRFGPNWIAAASVQATQPLLKGRAPKVNDLTRQLANQQLEVAELQKRQAANALIAESLDAYWRWVGAELALQARTASVTRTRKLSDATIAQIEAGQLAELERDIVAQRIAAAEQTLLGAEVAVLDATDVLRDALGESATANNTFTAPTQFARPTELPTVDEALAAARHASPDIALLQQQVAAANLATIRSKDQRIPQLDAVATLAQLGLAESLIDAMEQVATVDFTSFFVGLNFAVPLDNTFARKTHEADEVAVLLAKARRDDAHREVDLRVRQAHRVLQTHQKRLDLSETEIALATKNLAAMESKFAAGLASYLEVLQLEEDLSAAQERYDQARIDAITSLIALHRLTGELIDVWGVEVP